jgi:hypothetical protein
VSQEHVFMEKIITPPHFVRFYNDVACLAKEVSHFIGVGLEAGHAGVVIATPSLLEALDQRLSARGCDVTVPVTTMHGHERSEKWSRYS